MKEFSGKTLDEAIAKAIEETQTTKENLIYTIEDEKKGLFVKKTIINVYDLSDVVRSAEDYLLDVVDALEIESTVNTKIDDDIIRMTIDSTHNPILIGKNGKTLQAINELVKLAVNNKFRRRFRILVDINGYKDNKYDKLTWKARKIAKEVQQTHVTATLDPMPADERRIVHNALNNMTNIKTESKGEGTHRQVQIIFINKEGK
ncbi:MAG: KH domain-containing protein [Erysipelotrichia bacterium]|jgi:spoIIIJ-associated protein|nr:RNA-binding cell elongation regulator Jag/EloR [Bacilli bacterium]NLB49300.1 KH domain-containing protein [Erysipelotrichia bacterium]